MKYYKKHLLSTITVLVVVFASCTEEDQAIIQTAVVQAGQTAVAEGEQFAKTQAAELKETAVAAGKTQIAQAEETVIPQEFHTVLSAPYDACVGRSSTISSPLAKSEDVIEKGFGLATYSCDETQGALNSKVLLFGGKNGSVLNPPNYETDISNGIEFDFSSSFTGNLKVDVTLSVNSKTGAAAGSAMALMDLRDIVLEFLLPTQLGAFLDISESLIFQTGSGVKTNAYVYIDKIGTHDENTAVVGGHGFGASFPVPPYSQSEDYSSEQINISITIPVVEGEKVYIGAGIRTTALVHGWAVAYWNPSGMQEVFVSSVELTEVR
jgi:hypothetical protein